jgi:hypothetical protein
MAGNGTRYGIVSITIALISPKGDNPMASTVPYLASPGSLKTAFEKIQQAATPERVTGDFVTTVLGIKGGTGFALIPFFKKIGFVNGDGTPSELYKQFRNATLAGVAVASAIKNGYKPLSEVNEYFYKLGDKELLDLIVQVTGTEAKSSVAKFTLATLKTLKAFATFDVQDAPKRVEAIVATASEPPKPAKHTGDSHAIGLNLSYTINLNLPATADQAVFNAIFRSLKEHLLSNED